MTPRSPHEAARKRVERLIREMAKKEQWRDRTLRSIKVLPKHKRPAEAPRTPPAADPDDPFAD